MSGGVTSNLTWTVAGIPLCVLTVLNDLFGRRKMALQDKVVLITGAAGGLGETLAEVFYEAGCRVILSGRRSEPLENLKVKLSKKMKPKCHVPATLLMDLLDYHEIPEKINLGLSIFGRIDILINNAGIGSRGWIYQTDLEVYERVMKVNYLGHVHVTKAVLPHMMERKGGHIVVISSIGGKYCVPGRAPYIASKHALGGFFDTFRAELSLYNIGVTTICTPQIRTNFSLNAMNADGSAYNKMDKRTKTGLDPKYVARKVLKSAVYKKEETVIAPLHHQLFLCLRNMAPWMFFKIIAVVARREAAPLDLPYVTRKKDIIKTSRL